MPRRPTRRETPEALLGRTEALERRLTATPRSAADVRGDFHAVFTSERGRRVLAQILARCHMWEPTFYGEDTHETAFREGERQIGLWIYELMIDEPVEQTAVADSEEDE